MNPGVFVTLVVEDNGCGMPEEVIARIFPRVTLLRVFLAFSEVFGHLLELERLGAVERVSERRRERWRLIR